MCFWGEALILGPNINVPMMPEANAPALAALAKAVELAARRAAARPRADRGAREALLGRSQGRARRARRGLRRRDEGRGREAIPATTRSQALYAEALMDTQPWDYWEAGGAKPKGHGADDRRHARDGAASATRSIRARSTSTSTRSRPRRSPRRRCRTRDRLGALMPGAGHIVHMPAHIYYRVGLYRESLDDQQARDRRRRALLQHLALGSAVQVGLLPAQHPLPDGVGADGRRRHDRDRRGAASSTRRCPTRSSRQFAILQPVKAAPYTTHAQFCRSGHDPRAARAARRPRAGRRRCITTRAPSRSRRKKDAAARAGEIDAIARIERDADFKPFAEWGVPAKEIVQTARLVATGRLADAQGDLDGRRQGLRGGGLHRGHARLHGAAVLVLPGAPVARRRCGCARASSTTPRRRSASRSRACATTAGRWRGWPRRIKRKGDAAGEKSARQAFARRGSAIRRGRRSTACRRPVNSDAALA